MFMSSMGKLSYLLETKTLMKQAIIEKGISIEDSDSFRSYVDKIADISGGANEEELRDINNKLTEILGGDINV